VLVGDGENDCRSDSTERLSLALTCLPSLLPFRHLLLALVVILIWGANFVAIKFALHDLPAAVTLHDPNFCSSPIPAVFFLPRPRVPLRQLLAYGFTMFGIQFGFLFLGMKLGVSAGLASLALQLQVFVTLLLSAMILKERISGSKSAER